MKKDKETLMRIAICEDEQPDWQALKALLEDYLAKYDLSFEVTVFSTGEALLQALRTMDFSLLFLDVFMGDMNGMEAARRIRKLGLDLPIIFTTTSSDFAAESYEVDALYYIIKPVTCEKLAAAMRKCTEMLDAAQRCLEVVSDRETRQVYLRDILYAEAFGNQIMLHTTNEDIPTYQSLDALVKSCGESFLRCHRSFVVNMDYVKKVDRKDFVLTSGARVPIRTNGRSGVIEQYNYYFINQVRGK